MGYVITIFSKKKKKKKKKRRIDYLNLKYSGLSHIKKKNYVKGRGDCLNSKCCGLKSNAAKQFFFPFNLLLSRGMGELETIIISYR